MSSDPQTPSDPELPGFDVIQNDQTVDLRSLTYTAKYDHLTCPICKQPFIQPYTTVCGHTFCRSCILEALRSPMGNRCPLDRNELYYEEDDQARTRENDVFPSPIIVTNITDDLQVTCLNSERGCDWTGPRWQIRSHLLKDCPYTRFVCGRNDIEGHPCTKLSERRYLSEKSTATCPHIQFPCSLCEHLVCLVDQEWHLQHECEKHMECCHGCNVEYPVKDIEAHQESCAKIHVTCPGSKFGCDWRGSRELLASVHEKECVFVKMSGYLEQQAAKMDVVVAENTLLKSELASILDSVMQGRLTNLGFPQDLEEVNAPDSGSVLGSMEDGYAQLIADFEKLRANAQRARRALAELEVSKQVITGLAADNLQMKEEMSTQRLTLNSIRQQIQFMLLDRRRLNTQLTRMGSAGDEARTKL